MKNNSKIIFLFFLVILITACSDILGERKVNPDSYSMIGEIIEIRTDITIAEEKSAASKVLFSVDTPLSQFDLYENKNIGILYPKYWEIVEAYYGSDVVFLSPLKNRDDSFSENVNIVIQDISDFNWDMEKYTAFSIHQIRDLSDNGVILESRDIKFANLDGHYLLYVYKKDSHVLKSLAVYAIKGDIVYLLTYTAEEREYDNYINDIRKMIDSFDIK